MTPDRFRECLEILGWSQRGVAKMLQTDDRWVRRWAAGDPDYPIPDQVAAWLETMAGFWSETVKPFLKDHPPPKV